MQKVINYREKWKLHIKRMTEERIPKPYLGEEVCVSQ
jgi:hypothetical protein